MSNGKPAATSAADDFVMKCASLVADKVRTYLNTQATNCGPEVAREIAMGFLAQFVGSIAYQSLLDRPGGAGEMTHAELEKFVLSNFSHAKLRTQEAIAAGFQSAMTAFTKKEVEYYCTIRPVPEFRVNRKPC
jgi:hypothetical protein